MLSTYTNEIKPWNLRNLKKIKKIFEFWHISLKDIQMMNSVKDKKKLADIEYGYYFIGMDIL